MAMGKDAEGHPMANAYDQQVLGPFLDGLTYGMKSQAYRWQSSVGITATQILYAEGKVGVGIEIAKAYKRINEVKLENTKAQVRYDVENAFDQLIYLDSAIKIMYASKELLQENLNFVEQSLKSGMATELDLIRVQLSMDQLNSTIASAEKMRVLARNSLLNTMGLEWETDVQFQGELRDPAAGYSFPDTSMANVKKRRKELVMLEETANMKTLNVEIEQGGYKPTVVLLGGIKYANNKNEFFDWDAPTWDKLNKYIALNVSMNLFNGMKTREGVVQAKSSLRSTQIQKETAERGFRVQIESCVNTLEDANSQIEIAKRERCLQARARNALARAQRRKQPAHRKNRLHEGHRRMEQGLQRAPAGHRRVLIGRRYEPDYQSNHHRNRILASSHGLRHVQEER